MHEAYDLTYRFEMDASDRTFADGLWAYHSILGEAGIPRDWVELLLPLWLDGFTNQDYDRQRAALLPLLAGPTWKWGRFEKARRAFKERGRWPSDWVPIVDEVSDLRCSCREAPILLMQCAILPAIRAPTC